MLDGMSVAAFTAVHVSLSLVGIIAGLAVLVEMIQGRLSIGWTWLFLVTTVLASGTGFALPPFGLDEPRMIGMFCLGLLALAIAALYVSLVGHWRWIYIVATMMALYLNCFVGITQAFSKLAVLKPFAPNLTSPPFAVTQLIVLALFVGLAVLALRRFRPATGSTPVLTH